MLGFQLSLAASETGRGWLADNAALVIALFGITVSGIVGPSVAAWWTAKRERERDERAHVASQREDLRSVVDDAAAALGGAVPRLRPALDAELKGDPLP